MSNVIDISTPILQGVEQAAKTLGVSKHFIYTGVKSGKIPHVKSGAKLLINIPLTVQHISTPKVRNPYMMESNVKAVFRRKGGRLIDAARNITAFGRCKTARATDSTWRVVPLTMIESKAYLLDRGKKALCLNVKLGVIPATC